MWLCHHQTLHLNLNCIKLSHSQKSLIICFPQPWLTGPRKIDDGLCLTHQPWFADFFFFRKKKIKPKQNRFSLASLIILNCQNFKEYQQAQISGREELHFPSSVLPQPSSYLVTCYKESKTQTEFSHTFRRFLASRPQWWACMFGNVTVLSPSGSNKHFAWKIYSKADTVILQHQDASKFQRCLWAELSLGGVVPQD